MQENGANHGNKMAHRNFYGNSSVFFTKQWQNLRTFPRIASKGKYAKRVSTSGLASKYNYMNWLQEVKGLKGYYIHLW
jgi:hypothetical protein